MKTFKCKEPDCNNKISYWSYKYGKGRCLSCANKKERNPNFKNGNWYQIHYCKTITCDNPISYKNFLKGKRNCQKCAGKFHSKKRIGFKHTEKTLRKMSRTRIKKELSKGVKNPMFGKTPTNGKREWYHNIAFRSTWETLFAKWLDLSNIKWQYESKTFDLGNTTYTPDFYLPAFNHYIEIKGYWRKDAKKKFNEFKKLYSSINIKVFDKDKLMSIGVL